MASTHKHIRSGTANKRPTTAIADGQIALNTNLSSPGLFFKDSTGAEILKIGPVHVGATAPNASPAGSAGNSTGEIWLDTSLTPVGVKIWNGSAFVNATPIGSTTVRGLLELATDAETQAGADTARAVTPASLQSKLSDSTSTTSNTTIASSTAVKAAYDLANAALPKTGGTVTGNLEIGTAGSLSFEGATADGFETTIAVVDPTADRTITLPNITGTVVTTGDSGTVTSTMILDGTIVDADINASAEISVSKLVDGSARQLLQTDAAGTGVEWASNIDIPGTLDVTSAATFDSTVAVTGALTKSGSNVVTVGDTGTVTSTMILDGTILNSDVNASAAIAYSKLASLTSANILVGNSSNVATSTAVTGDVTISNAGVTAIAAGVIVNADVNASAAIVDTKLATIATAGKVSNSATTATNANTASAIVARDASGNFTAGTITAALTGAASSNVLKAGDTMTGALVHPLGAVGTPSITFTGDLNTGFWSPAADTLAASTAGSERLRITSAGLVGIGTSSPTSKLDVRGSATDFDGLRVLNTESSSGNQTSSAIRLGITNSFGAVDGIRNCRIQATEHNADSNEVHLDFYTNSAVELDQETVKMRLTSGGALGIGTTSPSYKLHVSGSTGIIKGESANATFGAPSFSLNDTAHSVEIILTPINGLGAFGTYTNHPLAFYTNNGEKARIDTSGRLLVGTSSALAAVGYTSNLQVQASSAGSAAVSVINTSNDAFGGGLINYKSRGSSSVQANDGLAQFRFTGYDGTAYIEAARISADVDGTPGTNDMPGRLVFSVTADGAASPTEAMRIKSTRIVNIANTPVHADNAAAKTAGLVDGDVYRKSDGTMMIVFT